VAVLLPTDDAWAKFTPGNDALSEVVERSLGSNVIPQILRAGFSFDFIDGEAIAKAGIPYRVLVLPHIERLPLATYELIRRYAQKGGIVIATGSLPSKAPGMLQAAKDSPRVREISQELFQGAEAKGVFVADELELSTGLEQHSTLTLQFRPNSAISALCTADCRLPKFIF
jgi:hypothetical protein